MTTKRWTGFGIKKNIFTKHGLIIILLEFYQNTYLNHYDKKVALKINIIIKLHKKHNYYFCLLKNLK